MPREHGGWMLTLEPALLALLIRGTTLGIAIAVAALFAFVARRPFRILMIDRRFHRWLPRTTAASIALLITALPIAIILTTVVWQRGMTPLVPLLIAVPFFVAATWFDIRGKSRHCAPELLGSIAIGSVATAIALAAHQTQTLAYFLWFVVTFRVLTSIPFVRAQIARSRNTSRATVESRDARFLLYGILAICILAMIVRAFPLAIAICFITICVFHLMQLRKPPRRAPVIGIQQTLIGIAVVVISAITVG